MLFINLKISYKMMHFIVYSITILGLCAVRLNKKFDAARLCV